MISQCRTLKTAGRSEIGNIVCFKPIAGCEFGANRSNGERDA